MGNKSKRNKGRKIQKRLCQIVCCVIIIVVCGCGKNSLPGAAQSITAAGRTSASGPVSDTGVLVKDSGIGTYEEPVAEEISVGTLSKSQYDLQREEIGLTPEGIAQLQSKQVGRYCYDSISDEDKILYVEILTILNSHAKDIRVSVNDADRLDDVFMCVFNDHPEIYWVDGYVYSRHDLANDSFFTFGGRYVYDIDECRTFQIGIDRYVSMALAGISRDASQYDKVKYVYEYLIRQTEFVEGAKDNQNILSVFLYGKSVCQGYAKATQYLLEKLGVPCVTVTGKVGAGQGHAWNLVNIDGSYYYLDTTWGDSAYLSENGMSVLGSREVSYTFLNITTQELERTHTIDYVVPLPYCFATEANYFVQEGLYFESYDEQVLAQKFAEAKNAGRDYLCFKCSDAAVYARFTDQLISQQKIFNVLPSENIRSIDYATDENNYIMNFWF